MRKLTLGALAIALSACADEKKGAVGDSCSAHEECALGLCSASVCLDPEGDDDNDGLINLVEDRLGSNPQHPDSDGDGILDPDELDQGLNLRDTDGDGKPDIIESRLADADGDCVPDELDSDDTQFATKEELSQFKAELCGAQGVCATYAQAIDISCVNQEPVCDYSAVPSYEVTELTCDGLDNDCDGQADEGCSSSDQDSDGDGVPDVADNCPQVPNADQADANGNGIGDACDQNASLIASVEGVLFSNWTEQTADMQASGSAPAGAIIQFSQNANCTDGLEVTVSPNGSFAFDMDVVRSQSSLYAQVSLNGEVGPCIVVETIFGPLTLNFDGDFEPLVGQMVQFHYPDGSPAGVAAIQGDGSVQFSNAMLGFMATIPLGSLEISPNDYSFVQLRTITNLDLAERYVFPLVPPPVFSESEWLPVEVNPGPNHGTEGTYFFWSDCGSSYAWLNPSSGLIEGSIPTDCFRDGQQDTYLAVLRVNASGAPVDASEFGHVSLADIENDSLLNSRSIWNRDTIASFDLILSNSGPRVSTELLGYLRGNSTIYQFSQQGRSWELATDGIDKGAVGWLNSVPDISHASLGLLSHGTLQSQQSFSKFNHIHPVTSGGALEFDVGKEGVPIPAELVSQLTDDGKSYGILGIKGWPEGYKPELSQVDVDYYDNSLTLEWKIYGHRDSDGAVIIPRFSAEFPLPAEMLLVNPETNGHFLSYTAWNYPADGSVFDQVSRIIKGGWYLEGLANQDVVKVPPELSYSTLTVHHTTLQSAR